MAEMKMQKISTEMIKSRTYNSILNSAFGIIASSVTVILNFFLRVILVKSLGEQIYGLHSLFQSITSIMALLEMGFSTAMVIHLYRPVKEENHEQTRAIMAFYKKVYTVIAIGFTVLCLVVDIFGISRFITTTIDITRVRIYFALFTFSFSIGYLTYYKRSILFAEQKNRISIMATAISELVFRGAEITAVLLFREYYWFLIFMVFEKLSGNIFCNIYVNKHHPYLRNYRGIEKNLALRKSIYTTVRPLFVNQIASTVQQSAKSILISKILGNIAIVGYFGNYQLVMGTAQLLFSQFGGAITSSFGNLASSQDKKRLYAAYRKSAFIMNGIAIIICSGFMCCIQDFIWIVFGKHFVLNIINVLLLDIDMLVYLYSIPIISIQNALGLHNKDKIVMVIQAIIAIIAGYILGTIYGMSGILIGLLVPQMALTLFNKGIVIFKEVFEIRCRYFLLFIINEILMAGIIVAICYFFGNFVNTGTMVLDFLLKGFIALIVSCILFITFSFRSPYLRDIIARGKKLIKR